MFYGMHCRVERANTNDLRLFEDESGEFFCNFEDNLCPLVNASNVNETWSMARADDVSSIPFDNTLNLGEPM